MFHHQQNLNRLQPYPMASPGGGTSTTFSQNAPLSSVGSILPTEGANNPMQVVQSNLNPNAPDFSSRASLLMAQHPGPHLQHLQRLPSGPNSFQPPENSPGLQFRPILASGGGMNPGFPLHPAMSAAMGRFSFHHLAANHQPQADFNPNSAAQAGAMGGMSQESEGGMPVMGVPGYHHPSAVPGSGSIPHFAPMQSMMGIRPNQRSSSTTPSVGTSSKDDGSPMAPMSPSASPQGSNLGSPTAGLAMQQENSNPNPAGTIGEDRKLPRPIGMERAQRKNPMFGAAEIPAEWLQNTMPHLPSDDGGNIPPSMQNYGGNRFPDMMPMEANHPVEQSFQAVGGGYPFVNGLPPHVLNPQLYQNNPQGQVDGEMWGMHQKTPSGGGGDGQNVEHKMTWQSWSPHQA